VHKVDVPLPSQIDDAAHQLKGGHQQSKVMLVPLVLHYPSIPGEKHTHESIGEVSCVVVLASLIPSSYYKGKKNCLYLPIRDR